VCVDTGVTGDLDAEQADWFRRISSRNQPKLLVTGKPLYVDNRRRPGPITDYVPPPNAPARSPRHRSVDEVVRDPAHRYIAAIGGDIHNYQRYEDRAGQGAPFTYLVSGGGGAYLGSTHEISVQKPGAFPNDTFAKITYPSPARSLQVYGERLVPEVWLSVLRLLFAFAGRFSAASW
jgi:hypothetical protein